MRKPTRASRPLVSTFAAVLLASGLLPGCDGGLALDLVTQDVDGSAGSASASVSSELPLPQPVLTSAQQHDAALSAFLASRQIAEVPEYRAASTDLDADGTDDLLMLLDDPNWCDSGGCSLLVFHGEEGADAGYRLVTQATVIHAPIAVSTQRHNGWLDLLVGVGADGIQAGTVALQFNGDGYPADPTLLAFLADGVPQRGQTLIE